MDRLLHLLLVIPAGCATKQAAAPARLQQLDWLQLWPRGEAAGQLNLIVKSYSEVYMIVVVTGRARAI